MAKFNIEVEIDWIDEEGSIDQIVKDAIESQIVDKVAKDIANDVKAEQAKKFHDQIEKAVNIMVNDTFESLLSVQVVKYDDYGDVKQTFPSVREMIKGKFDNYLSEMVDSKTGNRPEYSSQKVSRFDYIMGKSFANELDKKMKDLASETDKRVKAAVDEMYAKLQETLEKSVKSELGSRVADLMGLETLLLNAPEKKPK